MSHQTITVSKLAILPVYVSVVISSIALSGCANDSTTASNSSTNTQDRDAIDQTSSQQLKISANGCIGCGRCVMTDSEHFAIQGYKAIVISNDNLTSTKLTRAIAMCPTGAISLS
ncbi:MAG TPA: ferredoxin [bacterium]|nr:ferredoxin [bacterium]